MDSWQGNISPKDENCFFSFSKYKEQKHRPYISRYTMYIALKFHGAVNLGGKKVLKSSLEKIRKKRLNNINLM